MDEAVELFVSGRFEQALGRFEALRIRPGNEETRRLATLYTGRCYLALGEIEQAGQTFLEGRTLGWGSPFDAYLIRANNLLRALPENLIREHSITRAQLASLLVRFFGNEQIRGGQGENKRLRFPGVAEPADVASHWAKEPIIEAVANGLVATLPDGLFHPEEKVDRAAFLYIVCNLVASLVPGAFSFQGTFPRGVQDELYARLGVVFDGQDERFVSGEEAVTVARALSKEAGSRDGKRGP